MRLPVRVSAWIGAKQKFPTWLGPPRSSSRIFQSVHPSAPELKSLIIDRPYASPRLQRPYAVESKLAGVPSVNTRCLSGKSRLTSATLPYIWVPPDQSSYQWKPIPQAYFAAAESPKIV